MENKNSLSNEYLFSEEVLDTVEKIEFLAHSYAFEKYIYDNRIARTATHNNETPFLLDDSISVQLPENIAALIAGGESCVISELHIHQCDEKSDQNESSTSVNLSFKADDLKHNITGFIGENDNLNWTAENINGDEYEYKVPGDTYIKLLSALALNSHHTLGPTGQYQKSLQSPSRISSDQSTKEGESLIITLGNISGSSEIKTVAILESESANELLTVELTDTQSPYVDNLHNKLSVERSSSDFRKIETDSLHQLHDLSPSSSDYSNKGDYIESIVSENNESSLRLITPSENYQDYAKNCLELWKTIEEPMLEYWHLDE